MSILARNVVFRVLSPITEVEKFLSDYSCVKGILINVIYIQGLKKKWDKKCWVWISIRLRKQYDSPASIFKETIGKWKCQRTAMIKYFFRTFIYKGEDLHKRKNIKFILITSLWYTNRILLMHFLFYPRVEYQLYCTTIWTQLTIKKLFLAPCHTFTSHKFT